jgi:hypothetical protein
MWTWWREASEQEEPETRDAYRRAEQAELARWAKRAAAAAPERTRGESVAEYRDRRQQWADDRRGAIDWLREIGDSRKEISQALNRQLISEGRHIQTRSKQLQRLAQALGQG